MEKSTTTFVGIVCATLIIVIAVITVAGMSYPNGFTMVGASITSDYEYTVTITPTGDLTDVTLLIPIPGDRAGRDLGTPIMLTQANECPENWSLVLIGNPGETTYLKISTLYIPNKDVQDTIFHVKVPTDALIPTRNPEKGAYLFGSDENQMSDAAITDPSRKVFAKFSAEPSTTTEISASCTGENAWWWFGRSANAYTDRISTKINGSISGWLKTTGTLESGSGKYTII